MDVIARLAKELKADESRVRAVVDMIDGGNTVPFIARYRKEATGGMDDVMLRELEERLSRLRNLAKRKEEVLCSIEEQGRMTPELRAQIASAETLQRVEDLYKPYKKKRATRASKAKDAGLEPLAQLILSQAGRTGEDPLKIAAPYISEEGGYPDAASALQGAQDIVAETIAENAETVAKLRAFTWRTGLVEVKSTLPENEIEEDDRIKTEPARSMPNHRILAMNRAEKEGKARVYVRTNADEALRLLEKTLPHPHGPFASSLHDAVEDSYKRLMAPSLEREIRSELTERAQNEAIKVFAKNTKSLLLQRPVRGARIIALDPGYRTGCKVAVLDETGKLLDSTTVYPTPPKRDVEGTERTLARLIDKHRVNTIVIGNGTASRETEEVVSDFIAHKGLPIRYTIVNEAGASVYSASKLASEEYPDLDVTTRGAMSLGRRLQDPLSELVKIPPASIGVGQYQHDMDKGKLENALAKVVEDAVNSVGVDLNTASASLLNYVSGITATVAKNIVAYREENGPFQSRAQLKKVPKLGPKAYLNSAGFLRIPDGKNPLDATGVHPESYAIAKSVMEMARIDAKQISSSESGKLHELEQDASRIANELECGVPTLLDIIKELEKPGRDPRDDAPEVVFSKSAKSLEDLYEGMELNGTVRNVVDFGAFVDIGVKQDGLVHISKMAERFISHPSDVVSVGDTVKVWVRGVDTQKGKISLSMVESK